MSDRGLSTVKETWQFDVDLTYEHKIERYDSSINNGAVLPIFIFTTKMSLERGIWAPSDNILDQLTLFVMSAEGFATYIGASVFKLFAAGTSAARTSSAGIAPPALRPKTA